MSSDALVTRTLDELIIDDEDAFAVLPLYQALKAVVVDDGVTFAVLPASKTSRWDRALFLNLTYWGGGTDVLADDRVNADVVCHVAWHHLAARAFVRDGVLSKDALFFGEAVASAFDAWLVGALLAGGADETSSSFLETQVPAMAQTAEEAGLSQKAFEKLLSTVAADPGRAFEDLRQLLVDVTGALFPCRTPDEGLAVLQRFSRHRFAPLLHRFELSNWVLWARAWGAGAGAGVDVDDGVRGFDAALRAAGDPIGLLAASWLPAAR